VRPLELRLRNFRSYFGQEERFDFRGRRLIGIVGPIGSGKSTILDAIVFALYGKTPTIARSTKTLIHQRADDGAVALRFEVDGQVWEAVRLLRKGGASQHALYRLETDTDVDTEPDIVERVLQESEVNTRVAAMLGLEFDAFTRSVLLAQGRFAEFLTAPPADRDRVLKSLFGFGRIDLMREAARERNREAEVEAEKLGIRAEQLTDLEGQLETERGQLGEAADRLVRLTEADEGIAELAVEASDLERQRDRLEERLTELDEIAQRLPDPGVSADLLGRGTAAAATRRRLGETLAAAEADLGRARSALEVVEASAGKRAIDEATALLAEHRSLTDKAVDVANRVATIEERIVAVTEEASRAEAALEAASRELDETVTALTAASEAVSSAEAGLHDARHANMAMELRADLAPGERCPVCDQDVQSVPVAVIDVAVDEAKTILERARSARTERDRARLDGAGKEAALRAAVASTIESVEKLVSDLSVEREKLPPFLEATRAAEERLIAILGEGDHAGLLARVKDRHDEATGAVSAAVAAVERARLDLDEAIAVQQRVDTSLGDLRVQLVDTAARLGADIEVGDDPDAMASALDAVRDRWTGDRAESRERIASVQERMATVVAKRDDLLAALGIEGDFGAALAGVRERVELLSASVARTEGRLAEGDGVRADLRQHLERRDVFGRLASDLTDARFVRYLLDEERTRLSLLGSEHFQRLSSGRYRFTEDGAFDIADLTAAEAVRKPDSLSGGETFLASLALALALAEMVTSTGGRLDAFFLDEGFGTLDPEHLDLAMEGIEALAGDGSDRLVVVVSHVPELRHRLDDLIVLDRDPMTGDTRVVSR
jgi:DNA repair protein SbcC/Rad50